MNALERELIDVSRILTDNRIPYMVIGGIATAVWGEPRATLDVDVTVWVEDQDIDSVVSLLERRFRSLVSNPVGFIKETRVLPLESENGIRIDVIFGALPFELQAIERTIEVQVSGVSIRFCSPEDLILHKIVSEREKDLQDVRTIVARRITALDLAYLEPRIRELSDLLDRPCIWKSWTQWKEEADNPD